MKRALGYICILIFVVFACLLIGFLQLFTKTAGEDVALYLEWDSSAQILEDGTALPWNYMESMPECGSTYRFTGQLSRIQNNGYLSFEVSALEVTLCLNGEVLYTSSTLPHAAVPNLASVQIPLTRGTSGELVLTCRLLSDSYGIFPPLVRFWEQQENTSQTMAYANLTALPTGAFFLAVLLIMGFFLMGLSIGKPDWSLLVLIPALSGFAVYRLNKGQGYFFLPEWFFFLLDRKEVGYGSCLLLIMYLFMNRRRRYLNYFLQALLWSAVALAGCYGLSLLWDGRLSRYINEIILPELLSFSSLGLSYWISQWLCLVIVLIAGYSLFREYAEQSFQSRSLELQNHALLDSYHALEHRITESAASQHELNHNLTSLQCMLQGGDLAGAEALLARMLYVQRNLPRTVFTGNHTINIILQDAAGKAHQKGIRFQTAVEVPDKLNISDNNLCTLLMNLLDNALEAAEQTPPEKAYVSISIKTADLYLAVKCENSFTGTLRKNQRGDLLTTKDDPLCHGFGWRQMQKVAQRYQGSLLFSHTDDGVFTVQTALRIPD